MIVIARVSDGRVWIRLMSIVRLVLDRIGCALTTEVAVSMRENRRSWRRKDGMSCAAW